MARRFSAPIAVVLVVAYLLAGLWPAWRAVRSVEHARDYATYHYAVKAAAAGSDPYDTVALGELARAEKTRRSVHPYFYPPPFLVPMSWSVPLSLRAGADVWFWLGQAALVGVLLQLRRWFQAPPLALLFLLATFSPLADTAKMGQANLPVLLLVVIALRQRSGGFLAAAAMCKMSPALYLTGWAAQRRWRPVLVAMAGAVALSVLALPLVELPTQLRFYLEILPGFADGDYHGLTVPVTLPANHSIPDLFNQRWPGPDDETISTTAARAARATTLLVLTALTALAVHGRDRLGDACLAGTLTVLGVITPVYAFVHHLWFLLLPLAATAGALARGRLGPAWWLPLALSYTCLAVPLRALRAVQRSVPDLHWWLQESKFFAAVLLMVACAVATHRAPRETHRVPQETP